MFAELTKSYVEKAVQAERDNAIKNYGAIYASKHEAYAVLKEEVEEAKEQMDQYRKLMHLFWLSVRGKKITEVKNYSDKKHIGIIKKVAIQLAMEAIQIAAVSEKIEESLEKDFY